MSGFSIRLQLWLKLWFTSLPAIILMLLLPVAAYVLYMASSYRLAFFTSLFYERAAPLVVVFILQWCFSIDYDSKFVGQLLTYPIARWRIIAERALLASLLFISLMCLVSIGLAFFAGGYIWKGLLLSIPVYAGIGGVVVLGTVIGRHSIGGLCAGLAVWILSLYGGASSLYIRPHLLALPGLYEYVSGNLLAGENRWILYNRLCYIGLGLLLSVLSILHINRRSG
ncbi:hypothetical protein K0T92_08510 [Paenibacillus oenotherae]|uniref:ABC transporter permease n=1 Tax=Paenibacillus oenotherae TaxID=1435645 RepID=A0ABS7D5N2_9BACL|nr:hypothetical protein [Paenibacillus oenotherae]MBW7474786.1 hypothetical protein [Paenibacillus oenotherae]